MPFIKNHYPAIVTLASALFLWEIFVRITNQPIYILPAPSQVLKALINERNVLLIHTKTTILEAILGFVLALIIAAILAIIIDSLQFIKKGFYPILVASQTVPIIAIAPLIFIWFGFGILPKVIVVTIVAFFPIVISFVDGLDSSDKGVIQLLESMNAKKWQILFKAKLPSALPSLFSGLKIAATYSLMGAVIGEWLGASKGLGIYMKNTSNSFLTDQVFAAIFIIVTISILFYSLILFVESKLIPWHKKNN